MQRETQKSFIQHGFGTLSFLLKILFFGAISLKKPKITDAGHIVEGKKKKIRKVNNKDTSSERDKSQKIRHTNSLENQYIDKLPKLPNAQNDSHVVLPKIYLTNLKIEQQTERKTGPMPMPESKKINEHSFSNNKANDSNIYKKKTFHNKSKLQSLSKDELTKVFNKYRAKISCENTPSNELQSTPSRPVPELQTKPPPKIQEKSSFKEQSPKSKPPVKENLPNEKSPKAKPKETGGFSKKTSIDKSNEVVPLKKDEPKKSVSGTEGVMKQVSSQKNVENGENQKAKETEMKKEEVKEPDKGNIEESPIKENGNLELSPVKKEGSEEGKEYEEEIFEDPVEKN